MYLIEESPLYPYRGPVDLAFPDSEPPVEKKFDPGILQITAGAARLARQGIALHPFLRKHLSGDWGDHPDVDRASNDEAARYHLGSITSRYRTPAGDLMIVTYVDSETTILVPGER